MRSPSSRAVSLALLTIAAGCHLDKLVEPPPTGDLLVAPSAISVTAPAGSTAPHDAALAVRAVHDQQLHWSSTRAGSGAWLVVHETEGTTPDSLHLTLTPTGLGAGRYADTLLLSSDDPGTLPSRVPVTLTLEGCHPASLTLGVPLVDSLRTTDCASPHPPGRPARRFTMSGDAGDSVSFHLTSPTLAVLVRVDTSLAGTSPAFAESSTCTGNAGACLRYLVLPAHGTYVVEVTTTGGGAATGPFTLRADPPRAPNAPDSLRQTRNDSVTTVSAGGAVPETEFVIRGILRDPDLSDTLRLEVELQPVGTSFTGEITARSAPTAGGGTGFVHISGLSDGGTYHWRSRVVDETGRSTAWTSFGDNPESAPDLRVMVTASRLQFRQAPTTTAAGAPITPAVEVAAVDGNGSVVATFTGTVTLSLASGPTGATLSGDRSVSAVNGIATFSSLTLDLAGSGYTLLASSPAMVDATSPSFAITPGPATRLAFTQQPTSTSPGAPITPAVLVTAFDGYGNVATGFVGSVTITLGHDGSVLQNAVLGGTRTRNAAAGVARFADLTIDQVGSGYTLVATSSGLGNVTSDGFDIFPLTGSPSAQRFSQQPSSTTAGAAITPPVEVTIVDARGDPVTTYTDQVTVVLVGGTAGALLGGTASAIPTNGVARFTDLTVDRAGVGYQLLASTPSLPDRSSTSFDITAPPPTTGDVTVLTHTVGTYLDFDGYTVTVAGVSRGVVDNGSTTFTGLAAGITQVALTGVASNCTVAGNDPRNVTVIADTVVTTTFEVDCAPVTTPTPTQLQFAIQPPGTALVGGTFGVAVNAVDAQSALATGYTGRVSLTLSGAILGTTLAGTTAVDAVGGVATFNDLHLTGPCANCRLQAHATTLTNAQSDPFTVVVP